MKKTENLVRKQMGTVSIIFVELVGNKHFRFANSDTLYRQFNTFKPHLSKFRGRRHAALLIQTLDSKAGKSKSTFRIIDVLAIFDGAVILQFMNEQFWSHLKQEVGEENKLRATLEYVTWLHAVMTEYGRPNDFYPAAVTHLHTAALTLLKELA